MYRDIYMWYIKDVYRYLYVVYTYGLTLLIRDVYRYLYVVYKYGSTILIRSVLHIYPGGYKSSKRDGW